MQYEWKTLPELARAFAFGAVVFSLTALVGLGDVDDWRRLAVSVGVGAVSAGAAAALAMLTRKS